MSESPSFIDWLEPYMQARGLTQPKLAAYIGTTQSAVNRWYHGTVPNPATCRAIAKLFRVPNEEVLRAAGHLLPGDNAMAEDAAPYDRDLSRRLTAIARSLSPRDLAHWIEMGEIFARDSGADVNSAP